MENDYNKYGKAAEIRARRDEIKTGAGVVKN